uniref:Uncharacterized protein n=1 Tax=Timema bartmani TaxID=61472 RepID=A0A7R9I370_9NEOP|nr:unnamed protein product [Timema bartmani]
MSDALAMLAPKSCLEEPLEKLFFNLIQSRGKGDTFDVFWRDFGNKNLNGDNSEWIQFSPLILIGEDNSIVQFEDSPCKNV